ncbi:MAG: hypothetical protein ACYTFG_14540 [Planctomycetota bacterium]
MSVNPEIDEIRRRGRTTVLAFFLSGMGWMIVGTIMGFIGAVELVAPDALGSVGWLTFGRIRAAHTNTAILGFTVSIFPPWSGLPCTATNSDWSPRVPGTPRSWAE